MVQQTTYQTTGEFHFYQLRQKQWSVVSRTRSSTMYLLNSIVSNLDSLKNLQPLNYCKSYKLICNFLDNRIQTDTAYLDFAKAFHRVDHRLLLFKLERLGFSGSTLRYWFKDYLTDRFQRITALGASFTPLRVKSGIPQGSILGPYSS